MFLLTILLIANYSASDSVCVEEGTTTVEIIITTVVIDANTTARSKY